MLPCKSRSVYKDKIVEFQVHFFVRLIINNLLPFSFVEGETIRTHVKYESLALPTFTDFMSKLTTHVEQKIAAFFPEQVEIVFDGWPSTPTQFVTMTVSFQSSNNLGHSPRLLRFCRVENETDLGSVEHIKYPNYIPKLFGMTWESVDLVVEDNCNVNMCTAKLRGVRFVGSASRLFNVAVRDILENYGNVLFSINALMPMLKGLCREQNFERLLASCLGPVTTLGCALPLRCCYASSNWRTSFSARVRDSKWNLLYSCCKTFSKMSLRCSLWFGVGDQGTAEKWDKTCWYARTFWRGYWYPFFDKVLYVIHSDDCSQPVV